jgi:hypothetical protein
MPQRQRRPIVRIGLVALLSTAAAAVCLARSAPGPGAGAGASAASGVGAGGPSRTVFARPPPDPGVGEPTIESVSRQAARAIDACRDDPRPCVADALEAYANALRRLAPRLAPPLRNLPDIVARAAVRVRASHTNREAIGAVADAILQVHKVIALLRADDPITLNAETRSGAQVAAILEAADVRLEKATGL